jgi:integrase
MDDRTHARLAKVGLVEPRERTRATVASLMENVFTGLSVKEGTRRTYEQTRTSLEDLLGADRALTTINPFLAEKWRQDLASSGLSPATVSKRVKTARSWFKLAVRWGMIPSNPFADVKAGSQRNPERLVFVPRESVEKVLAVCSDPEMRALIALSRYGALRVPSEALLLRWQDIDWERGRVTVISPKTAGQGRPTRVIPLFGELREHLLAAFHAAPEGAEFVVQSARDPRVNLRTSLSRLLARAGVQAWPRLWHAMRAARATELAQQHPSHVAAAWCGHTETVAMGHYWQVRDEDFDKALRCTAVQKAAQHAPEWTRNARQPLNAETYADKENCTETRELQALAGVCGDTRSEMQTPRDCSRGVQVTPMGFEPMSPP